MSLLRLILAVLLGLETWILLGFGAAGLGVPWTPVTVIVLAALAGALAAGAAGALRQLDLRCGVSRRGGCSTATGT
jgi:hypothetical protein